MLSIIKFVLYGLFFAAAVFLYWFLPKYNYIHKNPQYCVNLTERIFYCGTDSRLESFYNLIKK
ncbi:MAG: hypothetical protein AAB351_02850 [Patescibacteria group bacterium]